MSFELLKPLLKRQQMEFLEELTRDFPDLAQIIERHTAAILVAMSQENPEMQKYEVLVTIAAFLLICMGSSESPQFKNSPQKERLLTQLSSAFLGGNKLKLRDNVDTTSPLSIINDRLFDPKTDPETLAIINAAITLYLQYARDQLTSLTSHRNPLGSSAHSVDRAKS